MKSHPLSMSHSAVLAVLVVAACFLSGCKSATVTSQRELAPATATGPTVIYVADFDLGAQTIQSEPGVLSGRPGPVGRVGERLYGTSEPPEVRARQLVNELANALVDALNQQGMTAMRQAPGAPLPSGGWLVRGVFTEVQEGNRLRRATIGFGSGQTELQVLTTVDDLSQGRPKPLYELGTEATSGQAPGAGPTLAVGPYGAAVRFVMAGKDLDKNVKQTAKQIASQILQRVPH